jgi:hypothetical protein
VTPHRWTLRVRSTEPGAASVVTRKHRFEAGGSAEFDEESPRISALEYVLGALGADLAVGFTGHARRGGVLVDHVEAIVQGELNDPLAALGVLGAKGHPGIERARVTVYVSSLERPERLLELWEESARASPLLQTFRAAFTVEVKVAIVP